MSDRPSPDREPRSLSREEMVSALFANLVIQQTNMALMLLGQAPHPETGERIQDLDGARMFIDQLEMIEVKTKGNLDKHEEQLLTQSLTSLRMAFVEAVESAPGAPSDTRPASAQPKDTPTQGSPAPADASASGAATEEEHPKKFSKKY
jgi:hypothetical protein